MGFHSIPLQRILAPDFTAPISSPGVRIWVAFPPRGFSPSTEWREARRQFQQRHSPPTLIARMEALALDDFERLCGEPPLADVPAMVDGFVEALRREGVDSASLLIYREAIEGVVAWATKQLRSAA
jgi:hypothetical protein